jgi:predicted peroxiredoxin
MKKEMNMKMRFGNTGFLTVVLCSCTALSAFGQATQTDRTRDGVFVHISHGADSPHRLLMALKMAVTMAEGGNDVLVYCDIDAVKVLGPNAQAVTFGEFSSSSEYLDRLNELKVPVVACPTCMKVAKIRPGDLRPAVGVAQKERFFTFTKGRILTLDY